MLSPTRHQRRQEAIWFILPCLLVVTGCGGISTLEERERELSEARFSDERRREALIENLAEVESHRQRVQSLEAQKTAATTRAAELEASLRAATEQATSLAAERVDLRAKLAESKDSYEKVQQSLEKVKGVASASAGELADLRLKGQDLESKLKRFAETQGSHKDENVRISRELEEARAELLKSRAVLRSFQEGSGSVPPGGAVTSEERVKQLEREVVGLKGENIALESQIQTLSKVTATAAAPGKESAGTESAPIARFEAPSNATPGVVYRENPAGLLREFGGIIQDRFYRVTRGEVAWDSFDLSLIGGVVLVLLWIVLGFVRRARVRRLIAQASVVMSKSRESPEYEPASAVSQPAARAESLRSRRPSPTRRTGGFSAVISSKSVSSGASDEESALATAVADAPEDFVEESEDLPSPRDATSGASPSARESIDDPLTRVFGSDRKRPEGPRASKNAPVVEPRKAIGAHSWEGSQESGGISRKEKAREDDLANTQIISKGPARTDRTHRSVESVPLLVPESKATGAPVRPQAAGSKGQPKEDEDREILTDLKAVINKKFDELMK